MLWAPEHFFLAPSHYIPRFFLDSAFSFFTSACTAPLAAIHYGGESLRRVECNKCVFIFFRLSYSPGLKEESRAAISFGIWVLRNESDRVSDLRLWIIPWSLFLQRRVQYNAAFFYAFSGCVCIRHPNWKVWEPNHSMNIESGKDWISQNMCDDELNLICIRSQAVNCVWDFFAYLCILYHVTKALWEVRLHEKFRLSFVRVVMRRAPNPLSSPSALRKASAKH